MDELKRHLVCGLGLVVESRHDGEDGGAGLCGLGHVAQMDEVERRLTDAENKLTTLFEGDICGALNER